MRGRSTILFPVPHLALILPWIEQIVALSHSSGSSSVVTRPTVYDRVIADEEQRARLHEYSKSIGLGHRCFTRGRSSNLIERTLDSILMEFERGLPRSGDSDDESAQHSVNQNQQYVEYWTRQEWRHIEAHADVDENLAKSLDEETEIDNKRLQSHFPSTYVEGDGHRYPLHGHVLYLQVGSKVNGPTVIFPGRSSGGQLHDDSHNDEACTEAVVVPAKEGRLLRFEGRDLHAVPRPHDLWMLPFVKGGAEYEPENDFGRSVILFNVWPGDESPPLGVPLDDPSSASAAEESDDERAQTLCSDFSAWEEVDVSAPSSTTAPSTNTMPESVKIWLLGNERRRKFPLRTLPLLAPSSGGRELVREALAEKSKVTKLMLRRS